GELTAYLDLMARKQASDLVLSVGAPPSIRIDGVTRHIGDTPLGSDEIRKMAYSVMNERQQKEFESTWEMNLAVSLGVRGGFRINVFRQRGEIALDARYITSHI